MGTLYENPGLIHPMTCTGNERLVRQWYDGRMGRGANNAWRLSQFEWLAWAAGYRQNQRSTDS